jgi:anionic cell wall polymer biosynthesis LytR-Cps2A-Psr (LCP) family protein
MKGKFLKYFGVSLLIVLIIVILGYIGLSIYLQSQKDSHFDELFGEQDSINVVLQDTLSAPTIDSVETQIIRVSNINELSKPCGYDADAGKNIRRVFSGRRINIAVIGVDSRLGNRYKHADANHVLSIIIDSAAIEITSIPRDTPADCGFEDSTGQNKLTVLYAAKGREEYLKEVASIANLDKIHYYVEVGFSQAMGLMELLGHSSAKKTLRVLRSRSGLGGDDFQRVYNQGQFIRQSIIKRFHELDGFWGDVLLKGGVSLVNTNISYPTAQNIVEKLSVRGFPRDSNSVKVRVRPPMPLRYKIYDFNDDEVISSLSTKIDMFNFERGVVDTNENPRVTIDLTERLWYKLHEAATDTGTKDYRVIQKLKTMFEQHCWLQVPIIDERNAIRDEFELLLTTAYMNQGKKAKADRIRRIVENEKNLFNNTSFESVNHLQLVDTLH